ncbi:MAG: LamG-like jellyroll fold domain-containing protein, partial [Planctomycetota bacterium]
LTLAACLLAAFLLWPAENGPDGAVADTRETLAPPAETTAFGYGVVAGQEEAVWAGRALETGELAPGGLLELSSGVVHLELFSGVRLLVRGPAAFTLESPMRMTLERGRLQARVPEPAIGFRVRTPAGELVDLGTEFAVDARSEATNDAEAGVRVRVLDGAVTVQPEKGSGEQSIRRVEPGVVWRWTDTEAGPDAAAALPAEPLEDARRRLAERRQGRRSDWEEARRQLLNDPRLFAFYAPGAAAEAGVVPNLAAGTERLSATDGVVIAAEPAPDRWEREGAALDVSRPGSRMRLAVEGESAGLTLLCWVKIGSLDRDYNSLLLSDGHEPRSPHWQLLRDGRLFLSIKLPDEVREANPDVQTKFLSPPIWTPARSGRWQMLAATYDPDSREVLHYLDGECVSRHDVSPALADAAGTVRIGRATVG